MGTNEHSGEQIHAEKNKNIVGKQNKNALQPTANSHTAKQIIESFVSHVMTLALCTLNTPSVCVCVCVFGTAFSLSQ